jgi:hypothetical protein
MKKIEIPEEIEIHVPLNGLNVLVNVLFINDDGSGMLFGSTSEYGNYVCELDVSTLNATLKYISQRTDINPIDVDHLISIDL